MTEHDIPRAWFWLFLAKNQTPVVRQAPYFPCDFWLFPKHKRQLKGKKISDKKEYYENLTRALDTTSLKCCLPSTDVIDRWGKFTHAYGDARSSHASALHWHSPGFFKKVGYFSNRVTCHMLLTFKEKHFNLDWKLVPRLLVLYTRLENYYIVEFQVVSG